MTDLEAWEDNLRWELERFERERDLPKTREPKQFPREAYKYGWDNPRLGVMLCSR